eukprot:3540591-Rhodomonas_salina.1
MCGVEEEIRYLSVILFSGYISGTVGRTSTNWVVLLHFHVTGRMRPMAFSLLTQYPDTRYPGTP